MRRTKLVSSVAGIALLAGACGGSSAKDGKTAAAPTTTTYSTVKGGAAATTAAVPTSNQKFSTRPTFAPTSEERAASAVAPAPVVTPEVLALTATRTQAASTGKLDMTMVASIVPGSAVTMTATGVYDNAHNRSSMTIRMGSQPAIEVITDQQTAYMRMPRGSANLPAGKEWVKVSATGALSDRSNLNSVNPAGSLDMLRGLGADITTVGIEKIDGVSTNHYRVQVKMADVLANLGEEETAGMKNYLDTAGVSGKELGSLVYDVDVWIGSDGFARQMNLAFDLASVGQTGSVVIKLRLSDFGTPVDIKTPDPAKVVDGKSIGLG